MAKPKSKPAAKAPAKRVVKKTAVKAQAATVKRAPVAKKAKPKAKVAAKPAKAAVKAVAAVENETPAEVIAIQEQHLNRVELRFVEEYIIDLHGTKAYMRVCPEVTEGSAATLSSRLLKKVEIQTALSAAFEARSVRTGITADKVLQECWRIATADARELIEFRKGACRHCFGKDGLYQRTKAEMTRDREKHEIAQNALSEEDDDHTYVEFDEKGGVGYDARKTPNPECTECWGEGVGRSVIKDTKHLSKEAAALYAGVKVTKEGLEVKMHSKMDAVEKLAKHLGVYEKDNKQTGEAMAGGLAALLKAMKRSSLPVVQDPGA